MSIHLRAYGRGLSRFLWQDATKMGLSPLPRRLTQKTVQGLRACVGFTCAGQRLDDLA